MIQSCSFATLSLTALLFFLVVFGRYVLFSLAFNWLFPQPATDGPPTRPPIQARRPKADQHWREIGWSALTSVIFAGIGLGVLIAFQAGYTRIYTDLHEYGLVWYGLSIGLVLLLQETYYYWLHRWMHKPGVYRWVHKTHHDSLTTSPWTAFSFHPIESTLQAILLPVLTFILPLHSTAIVLILMIMTVSGAINHLNTEIYPHAFNRHWLGKWLIGATHHSLHHSQFRYNYGLFFTFWDRWMRTESPDFDPLFAEKSRKENHHQNHTDAATVTDQECR
ncbi:sterol desaturase family protein [Spirosoma rhododendri]|uniref:Sterol desaturase family protein n=1 Tax=Spirosoma rhododendri TaxID=2728024 RepID=A0A7L5DMT4_9BACT|nr:sterol desaturase family protein [Spirosoma rhododendri]QJD79759.1 sterol desaturase family protein [Spirosoma rhododendri]